MADATYGPKVYRRQGGDELVVASGGSIDIESGGSLELAGTAITATAAELNALDGLTATVTELNKLDGLTATVEELNILDGVTSTADELNILDGVTATASELNSLDDSAAFADGLGRVRVATATYDFDVDGGAISAIGLGVSIPDNAIVLDGMVDVTATLTTAGADAGTVAIHIQSANDLVTAVAVSDGSNPWDAGLHDIIPVGSAATALKMTAAREITVTIAGQVVTAGAFVVHLRYVLSA